MRASISFIVVCCGLCVCEAGAQYRFERLLSIPWGDRISDVGIRRETDGNYGPQSFDVNGDRIYLLDTEHRLLKFFDISGNLELTIPVPQFAQDVAASHIRNFYVLSEGKTITEFDERGIRQAEILWDDDLSTITGIRTAHSGLVVCASSGESYEVAASSSTLPRASAVFVKRLGWIGPSGYSCYTEKKSPGLGSVSLMDDQACLVSSFTIPFVQDDLASLRFVGSDSSGSIFLDVERFARKVPLKVNREIREYSFPGELLNVIRLPRICYSYLFADVRIGVGGEVYHLLSRESGIEIVRWRRDSLRTSVPDHTVHFAEYPSEYQYEVHYNDLHREDSYGDMPTGVPRITSVTRDEALQIGDTYVKHVWVCHDNNLTHGTITAPDGMRICSPDWISIGQNTSVCYQWGGFNTLNEFDAGLLGGKCAGDIYTSKDYGSSYCVGVDCSGFVSRCWKLAYHCPTSTMSSITVAYGSWEQLKKGDAIHKIGHVRMCIQTNPSGTVNVVESSGVDWRVSYRTYTFSQLTGYTPRYYVGISDAPTFAMDAKAPIGFMLEQNYPNPFNPNTRVKYRVPERSRVSLLVCDVLGREVATLVNGEKASGEHEVVFDASNLPSGVYIYVLSIASKGDAVHAEGRKMTLLR